MKFDGPPPKPPSKRRRTNTPANYGLAEPVKGGKAGVQPPLGFDPHPMVARMWAALGGSVEGRFFSMADWERANLELFFIHRILTGEVDMNAANWARVQTGLSDLLVSPADKRRAGIELQAAASDADEDAADLTMARYQKKLAG